MNFTQPFSETKETFTKWWNREDPGHPLMKLIGRDEEIVYPPYPATHRGFRMDAHYRYAYKSAEFENATFYADTLPVIDLNIGAGSVAVYMGSEPIFRKESVWFSPIIQDGNLEPLKSLAYNPDSYWLKEHLRQVGILKELTKGQPYRITIPDLVESLDIVAAFCSPNELCYLLMDEPELIHQAIEAVDSCYFKYYDAFYDLVKDSDGGSNFTWFNIYSPGRTAKLQCDFSAMISPEMFREFVIPSFRKQIAGLDYTLFHMDGKEAVRHLEALMELEGLDALQWTPNAGMPDSGWEEWMAILIGVRAA